MFFSFFKSPCALFSTSKPNGWHNCRVPNTDRRGSAENRRACCSCAQVQSRSLCVCEFGATVGQQPPGRLAELEPAGPVAPHCVAHVGRVALPAAVQVRRALPGHGRNRADRRGRHWLKFCVCRKRRERQRRDFKVGQEWRAAAGRGVSDVSRDTLNVFYTIHILFLYLYLCHTYTLNIWTLPVLVCSTYNLHIRILYVYLY